MCENDRTALDAAKQAGITKTRLIRSVNARMAGAGAIAYAEFIEREGSVTPLNLDDLVAEIYAAVEWERRYLIALNDPTISSS